MQINKSKLYAGVKRKPTEGEQNEENEDEENDPIAYAELISTNGCEDIPRVISEAFEIKKPNRYAKRRLKLPHYKNKN